MRRPRVVGGAKVGVGRAHSLWWEGSCDRDFQINNTRLV
jgi:hypothetical protein